MTSKVLIIIIGDQQILIDKKDLKNVDLSNLRITSNGYVMIGGKFLHRIIMNPPANLQVDHRNKNTLDNRKCNLRICTNSENAMNRGKQKNNYSGFKGVRLDKRRKRKKFRAKITANKIIYHLGSFEKADEARAAYRKAAKQLHGQFARICDPDFRKGKNHET